MGADELRTESDVEQKLLFPFLTHASYLGLPSKWVRTKEYMTPTEIDKAAGKKYGYIPDYSVWLGGLPMVIVEAKSPDTAIEVGLREAHLYAGQINKRYPPNVNPIGFVLVSNGVQFALSESDSETTVLIAPCEDAGPGSSVLQAIQNAIGKAELEKRNKALLAHFQSQNLFSVSSFMGGQARLNQLMGVNEFAEALFPTLTTYFGSTSDETPDDVIDRAYVSTDELGRYEGVLETYLKDRPAKLAGNQIRPIATTRHSATGISDELKKFTSNPTFFSHVQLIIGAVGAGKSTFIRRYYRKLRSKEVTERTRWAFLDFNVVPPGGPEVLREWIAKRFVDSFAEVNQIDVFELKQIERIFSVELNKFEKGPARLLKNADQTEYLRRKTSLLESLSNDAPKFAQGIARHYSSEKGFGIVIVFDNVDKRSREQQLAVFEAAQWLKDITRALILINLRDTTFEAHRDEPPLDAFTNAINFYIRPPRFAQVIRKRLELVLESLAGDVDKQLEYSLESGMRIKYPASRLGEFLLGVYISLFDRQSTHIAFALEALVAKDVRRALGIFGDIIVSPHVPTRQITGAGLSSGENLIQENRIIRALMRGRYKYYTGKSAYIRNVLRADSNHNRPSNLLNADILEYLIRNRKEKIDFAQEGYATIGTIVKKIGRLGYDEEDIFDAVGTLVEWGLIDPESLVLTELTEEDAVCVHASGFIHMRFFLERNEYLVGVTPDMNFASREVAEEIGRTWAGQDHLPDLNLASKKRIMTKLKEYLAFEYSRRCRRHAFYEEAGYGGRALVHAAERAIEHLDGVKGFHLRPERSGLPR